MKERGDGFVWSEGEPYKRLALSSVFSPSQPHTEPNDGRPSPQTNTSSFGM